MELLVVTGLVATLAGLLLPALSRAREKSRQAVCVANLRQLGQATQMYTDEFGSLPNGPLSGYLLWNGTDYLLLGHLTAVYGLGIGRSCFCPSSQSFPVDASSTGLANLGVAGRVTAAGYVLRGTNDGAPSRFTTDLRALLADVHDPATDAVNHSGVVNVLYTDGSVRSAAVAADWRLVGATAWGQLE